MFWNTWQFNLLAFFIGIVVYYQSYKLAAKGARLEGAVTVLMQTLGGLSILLLIPLFPLKFSTDYRIYLLLLTCCVFYALYDRLYTNIMKHLEVSVVSIMDQLSTVFLIIFGFTIFGEDIKLTKICGAALILSANIFLLYKKGEFHINKSILIAILANLIFAIALSIDVGISTEFNLPIYISATLLLPSIFITLGERIKINQLISAYREGNKKFILITGACWGLLIFFALRAFQFGEVTVIVPLKTVSVLLNVIFAYLFLKEKENKYRKILGAFIIIAGSYLTVM